MVTLKENSVYPKVVFIVLNWNGWQDTIECLKSIDEVNYPNYYFIMVDNASEDDSIDRIMGYCNGLVAEDTKNKKSGLNLEKNVLEIDFKNLNSTEIDHDHFQNSNQLKNIIFIKNDENYGFTGGNNIALEFAKDKLKPDYYLLLNNDTVVEPDFLKNMMDSVGNHVNVGFAGPKIYYHDPKQVSNLLSFAGGTINLNTSAPSPIAKDQIDNGQYEEDKIVDYVEGSCMLVSSELAETVGFFNQDYFTYWEEIDWCIRGKKAGFNTIYTHKAKIWHKCYGSDVGALSIYYMIRNRFIFIKMNETKGQQFTSLLYYFCYYFWKILFSLAFIRRDKTRLNSFLKGTVDGVKNVKGKK